MRECLALLIIGLLVIPSDAQDVAEVKPLDASGNDLTVTAFALDNGNNKYVGSDAGLIKVGVDGAVEPIYTEGPVSGVVWHNTHGLWIATDRGVIINPETDQRIELETDTVQIRSMSISGSQLWIGTDRGVYTVSTKRDKVVRHFTTENSKLASDTINDIFVDPSRIKWLATPKGVVRVEDQKWKLYEKDYAFNAITGNSEGVWLAADGEMWLVDPYNRWTPTDVGRDLSRGQVRALAADARGNVYILSDKLVQFDPYTDKATSVTTDYNFQPGNKAAILFDLDDRLWLGSLEYGLVAMDFKNDGPRPLSAYISANNPTCSGDTDGTVKVTATGGAPPYSYSWSSESMSGENPVNIGPGNYTVTVTDTDSSTFVATTKVADPQLLEVSVAFDPISQRGTAKASGGTGGYSYLWSDGSSGQDLVLNQGKQYFVSVTDRAGCKVTGSYTAPVVATESADDDEAQVEAAAVVSAEGLESVDSEVLKELDAATLAIGQTLRIEQLFFDADSSSIKNASYKVLDEVYDFLSKNDGIVIEIGGHTNGLPDHAYCDRLSTARASSVADYLYDKGISKERVLAKGYGKRQPIASNGTVEGRIKNQRVEIKILQI